MANIGTTLYTTFFGKKTGEDEFGNKYYESSKFFGKHIGTYNKGRRWVVFKGKAEASKIPPYWHGWIHFSTDDVPSEKDMKKQYSWQQDPIPNVTGTDFSYLPPGHKRNKGKRDKATGDYDAWKP